MSAAAQYLTTLPRKQNPCGSLAIVLIDALGLELALLLGCLSRFTFKTLFPISLGPPQYIGLAIGVLTLPLAYASVGLYPGYGMGAVQRLRGRVYTTFLVFVVLLAWNYTFEDRLWSRGVLCCTAVFALVLPPLLQSFSRRILIRYGVCGLPVVILGAGKTGSLVVKKLKEDQDLGLSPIRILDDDRDKWGTVIHGIPVSGPLASVTEYEGLAKVAVIAIPEMDRGRLADLVQHLSFASVIVVPNLNGLQTLWITSRDLGGVLGLELKKNLLVPKNRFLKRMLDCAIAAPALLISAPLIAICAVWVKAASPGPVLFRQEREGEDGKRITVWKLRTMYPDSERVLANYLQANPAEKVNWLRHYKLKKDPRVVSRVGWFLRHSSLDELPQLWNVLRGDMSLVGPRPFPYYHLSNFSNSFRDLRTSVTPGLTGLWQVSERSDGDLIVQEAEDTYYIRNWSLWLDIYILLCTVRTVLLPRGAY
ncbi:MAG: exopolysaccharide biosynthesis polyprenyl glycosylphosphotransferase [Bryobacteraceae bacterium]